MPRTPSAAGKARVVRRKSPEVRQEELIQAAAAVFNESGYRGATIQQIADRIGLLKGSLYHYIDSKEDLLFEIISDIHAKFDDLAGEAVSRASAREGLRHLLYGHCEILCLNHVAARAYVEDFRHLTSPRLEQVLGRRDTYQRSARSMVVRGQEEGWVADDLDLDLAVRGVLNMVNGVYFWFSPDGKTEIADICECYAELGLRALAPAASTN